MPKRKAPTKLEGLLDELADIGEAKEGRHSFFEPARANSSRISLALIPEDGACEELAEDLRVRV